MLDLYKLHIFLVVVDQGSFSAAAEQFHMTQPAVSQHIKELESRLGSRLFDRGWRGVTLTAEGKILHRYTVEIFKLVASAENALTNVDNLASGRVSIGATPGIGVYLAPNWIQAFRTHYPQLTVALQTGTTSEIVSDVLAQRLDIGFIEGELDDYPQPRLSSLVLEDIEQQVVVGFKHPYWDAHSLTIEDLRQQSLIVRELSSQSRLWLDGVLHEHDIEPLIGAEFDNLESIKHSVSMGMYLAVLPPYAVQSEVDRGLLRMIPVAGKRLTRSLKLIWNSNLPFGPISRAFLVELSGSYVVLESLLKQSEDQNGQRPNSS